MPAWNPEEVRQIQPLAREIAGSGFPRSRIPLTAPLDLKLSHALDLIDGLAGSTRALPVRQLLRALGFDEHRHLQWRVEHKLIQALLLHEWVAECIPVTCGLQALAHQFKGDDLRRVLAARFSSGYVIKSALGDSSGEAPREEPDAILRTLSLDSAAISEVLQERWIVQQRVEIATEYRVHSLEEDVVEDLTFRRYEGGAIPGERDAPNAFVRAILGHLPDALVGNSLLAWDVVLQPSGEFAIIEVNFSGFHPEFKRGFHTSGYFHDARWGACDTARLLNHIAQTDGVAVTAVPDDPNYPRENLFYFETANWQLRHRGLAPALMTPAPDMRPVAEIIQPLIHAIDAFEGPRHHPPIDGALELRLSDAIPLLDGLAASTRSLLMRQALLAMGFDERRMTPWRLEHKLLQALVFRHYSPDSLPATYGLDRLAYGTEISGLRQLLRRTFPEGFVIKPALGDCSGSDCDGLTTSILAWIEKGGRTMPASGGLSAEEFIVQERKSVRLEYRVHTIEDRVIEDLTVHRHQGVVAPGEREGPNCFVQRILDGLPSGITSGSHLAWDVALLEDGGFSAIEVNVGGIHTIYNPGFHASGFFHHRDYGAIYSARLLLFLERTYRCSISVVADAAEYHDESYFYLEVADWKKRF